MQTLTPAMTSGSGVLASAVTTRRSYGPLIAAHVAMGAAAFVWRPAATVMVIAVVAQALWAGFGSPRAESAVVAVGYLTGTEVFWRMTGARVPWEFTKYMIVLVCCTAMVRFALHPRSRLPLVFLAVLVPSSVITVLAMPLGEAREAIVSNLLGPATLGVVAVVSLSLVSDRDAAARVLWSFVVALVPMATFMALTLTTARDLVFTDESNLLASGGFGPNQVSAALSIGLLAITLLLAVLGERQDRALLVFLGGWFLIAMILTFSRGGVVSALVAVVLLTVTMQRDTRRMLITLATLGVSAGVVVGLVIPQLDSFTDGGLDKRYSEESTSHRGSIARSDLAIFTTYPLLGAGPGRSQELRGEGEAQGRQSHVMQTRMLAEHGIFGLVALLSLVSMVIRAVSRAEDQRERAWSMSLMAWAFVTMAHADTRIAAVGVAFGLGCLTIRFTPPARRALGTVGGVPRVRYGVAERAVTGY